MIHALRSPSSLAIMAATWLTMEEQRTMMIDGLREMHGGVYTTKRVLQLVVSAGALQLSFAATALKNGCATGRGFYTNGRLARAWSWQRRPLTFARSC